MLSNQEKLLEFQKSIQRELSEQIATIDREIEQYRTAQSQAIEDEVYNDCYRMIQKAVANMNLHFTTERSQQLSELKRSLLLRRDEYAGEIFGVVRQKLLEYTGGTEYPAYLRRKLEKIRQEYSPSHPVIRIREQDMALQNVFGDVFPGCSLETDEEITLGGFILEEPGKSYIINESLDNILEEQKEWFYSNSGLRVPQF